MKVTPLYPSNKLGKDPWWLLIDPFMIISALAIAALGSVLVYSATRGADGVFADPDTGFLSRQVVFAAVGVIAGVAASQFNPPQIRRLSLFAYAGTLGALLAVLYLGVTVKGTRGWFELADMRFQPSEPGKVVVIVVLAWVLTPVSVEVGPRRLLGAAAVAAAPMALILQQPDLGTLLVYLAITMVMVVVSTVPTRWIVAAALLAVAGSALVLNSNTLAAYQEARLTVFLFESADLSEEAARFAYHAEQAEIAIGNGGLTGQGLFQGTQTRSDHVPDQQTDFIFTVVGEELGFRGAAALLGLYSLLLFRIWRTAQVASSAFGRLTCIGVFAMFFFQMFQAVGMTMGMMPVTGIPFPLVSYGGSSMLTSMTSLGLVAGVYRRRRQVVSDDPR